MSGQEPSGSIGSKFDPSRYLRQLRGRGGTTDYLDVKWRLVWLRSEHPDAEIVTEHVTITADLAIFKARVTIPGGGAATGYGSETARDFGDFIEKAETKALGRALIALGYGTQFAQEFGEDDDVVSPVDGAPRGEIGPLRVSTRPETPPARPAPAPAMPARTAPAPLTARAEAIPADTRRAAPVRPIREAELAEAPAPAARPEPPAPEETEQLPAASVEEAVPRRPTRLSPPQPAPRPAPRPTATPAVTHEPLEDAGEIDLANYGWTEFWSWARARGFSDRKALDAIVGRSTVGMTPLEIRKQIQAKQG